MNANVSEVRASIGIPPCQTNGGWSTGRIAEPGAAWATIPSVPDAGYMLTVDLASAGPPPGASSQFHPSSFRPGNNTPYMSGRVRMGNPTMGLDALCVSSVPTSMPWTSWDPVHTFAPFSVANGRDPVTDTQ